ncbi:hypothetical protein GobsT_63420 [Gemmata obscuriglobus]|uniref:Uncharacterized protein n=1 Tax=Gemmata obscuriglobus TaxID=114 RepID=A0A2Z3GYJ2_9BACT|nr:hypothetical protein [Gemmata obscuriglobus]AWM35925.1 hypothetical protein C1280_02120 [Gemmata obscuriglobus]QEG31520.1 hypothetical protein GobsT_63420 [Gemmata obscuriglobus]VTS10862.1 unnamed protein product [Gemmata obscuriglobus UQM 2246]
MSGHTVAEIRAMSQRLRDLATRAAYHRCRAAAHTANAALADREADLVQEQLTQAVRDSQHEVEVVLVGETGAAPPLDPSSTPPVPTKKE